MGHNTLYWIFLVGKMGYRVFLDIYVLCPITQIIFNFETLSREILCEVIYYQYVIMRPEHRFL